MAKITIDDILTNFASQSAMNARFQQIEDELNNKVLYRVNPTGEPNAMSNDIDLGDNDLLNVNAITTGAISIGGVLAIPTELAIAPDADAVAYDNTGSGLTAIEVQSAIDEVEARVDTAETTITSNTADTVTNAAAIAVNDDNIDDVNAALGTTLGDTDMGTLTGTVLTSDVPAKTNIQELGTQVDSTVTAVAANTSAINGITAIHTGRVTTGGTVIDRTNTSGWTAAWNGTYVTVTHNLGHTDYTVTSNIILAGTGGVYSKVDTLLTNSFTIHMEAVATVGADRNDDFNFTLIEV